MCSPCLWWVVTAKKDTPLFPSQWGAAIWVLSRVMPVCNTFLSTSVPRDHIHMLCKTLTAGQLCALPWRHETAKGSFYSHLFLCTIILWKTSRNQCFPFFLCVQQHKRDHCVWGWWSSGSVSDDLLLSLPFAFLPTAHCCRLILHTLHVICAEAEHVNTETWKGKLFFKVASKRFLFILFIQKLPHHWKERKNNTCENSKLLLIES